jgi:hypothetical protein
MVVAGGLETETFSAVTLFDDPESAPSGLAATALADLALGTRHAGCLALVPALPLAAFDPASRGLGELAVAFAAGAALDPCSFTGHLDLSSISPRTN